MRFLFVSPEFCPLGDRSTPKIRFSSDSTSRRTPLPSARPFRYRAASGLSPYRTCAHRAHQTERVGGARRTARTLSVCDLIPDLLVGLVAWNTGTGTLQYTLCSASWTFSKAFPQNWDQPLFATKSLPAAGAVVIEQTGSPAHFFKLRISRASSGVATSLPYSRITRAARSTNWALLSASLPLAYITLSSMPTRMCPPKATAP